MNSLSDESTAGLSRIGDRRDWALLVQLEDERCRHYGTPACVFVVDLDGFKAIDRTLGTAECHRHFLRAATAVTSTFRMHDVVARTAGDEFSIIASECDDVLGELLLARLQVKLSKASVAASVGFGFAAATPAVNLRRAAAAATGAARRSRKRLSRTA